MNLIVSVLYLDRKAVRKLKIDGPYALHRVVYSLFTDVRSAQEKKASKPSGFLYADLGGNYKSRKILLLSDRSPAQRVDGQYGEVQSKEIPAGFLQYDAYQFKVIVNPTRRDSVSRKLVPVKGREAISEWFMERAQNSWGFNAMRSKLQINNVEVLSFKSKFQRNITLAQAHVQGVLTVSDREKFIESFRKGVGRGRAFGCGLLQIAPLVTSINE